MYESRRRGERTGRRRRRRRQRARLCLVCALAAGCLLMGAGRRAVRAAADPPVTAVWAGPEEQPAARPVESKPPEAAPFSPDDWSLILVNPWNPLPEGYEVTLVELKNGHAVDERCYGALQEMMDDCRAAGLSPVICSSYRSGEKQEALFQRQVERLLARGYAPEAARAEAGKAVAVPGTSEHQLGLAVDVVDRDNQNLNESQERTAVQKWMMENCWKYGFILRYPNDKSEITGIIYEPWHYRYVGREAAEAIHGQGICLEEFLEQPAA